MMRVPRVRQWQPRTQINAGKAAQLMREKPEETIGRYFVVIGVSLPAEELAVIDALCAKLRVSRSFLLRELALEKAKDL